MRLGSSFAYPLLPDRETAYRTTAPLFTWSSIRLAPSLSFYFFLLETPGCRPCRPQPHSCPSRALLALLWCRPCSNSSRDAQTPSSLTSHAHLSTHLYLSILLSLPGVSPLQRITTHSSSTPCVRRCFPFFPVVFVFLCMCVWSVFCLFHFRCGAALSQFFVFFSPRLFLVVVVRLPSDQISRAPPPTLLLVVPAARGSLLIGALSLSLSPLLRVCVHAAVRAPGFSKSYLFTTAYTISSLAVARRLALHSRLLSRERHRNLHPLLSSPFPVITRHSEGTTWRERATCAPDNPLHAFGDVHRSQKENKEKKGDCRRTQAGSITRRWHTLILVFVCPRLCHSETTQ